MTILAHQRSGQSPFHPPPLNPPLLKLLTDPELVVSGKTTQPVEMRARLHLCQMRVLSVTELGGSVPRQTVFIEAVTRSFVHRPPCVYTMTVGELVRYEMLF